MGKRGRDNDGGNEDSQLSVVSRHVCGLPQIGNIWLRARLISMQMVSEEEQ